MATPSWMTDMFGDIFGNQDKDDSKKFTEFKSGHDRVKNKSLDKRLQRNPTHYRKSMPAPIHGSAPSIDSQVSKVAPGDEPQGALPGQGRGVSFFGYGAVTKVNRFSESDKSEMETNIAARDRVEISGFTTFKRPMSESDYGKGIPGAAADASFYRNRIKAERYGELYQQKSMNSLSSNVVAVTTNNGIITKMLDDTEGVGSTIENRNKSFAEASGNANGSSIPPPGVKSQPDPLGEVPRKLPGLETGSDLFLAKYLQNSTGMSIGKGNLYKARGELTGLTLGGELPYAPDSTGKFQRYSDVLLEQRQFGKQRVASEDNSNPVATNALANPDKPSNDPNVKPNLGIISHGDDGKSSVDSFENEHTSNLLSSTNPIKKTLENRKVVVHSPVKVEASLPTSTRVSRKTTMSTDPSLLGGIDTADKQASETFVSNNANSTLDDRIENKYHTSTDLPKTNELPKNYDGNGSPKNVTLVNLADKNDGGKDGEAGRFNKQSADFKREYDDALKSKVGATSESPSDEAKNFNAHKTYDLLKHVIPNQDGNKLKYEDLHKKNPYYLKSRKVPDYYQGTQSVVSEKEDNFRIDNFNKKSVLDAEDAKENTMPEWAREDFIPLYFHDLVNKKYIPFRSFINTLSDQTDAQWGATQYLGRADNVQIYTGFTRTMSVDFNVVAFSIDELHPMWQRINYMVGLCKPSKYTDSGFIVPPLVKFNLGDIYRNQPVCITSVATSIPAEASWELVNNEKSNGDVKKQEYMFAGGDIKKTKVNVARYPTMCTLAVSMTILEKQIPETIQNHFGTTKENSGETAAGVFNYDLTKYPEMKKDPGPKPQTSAAIAAGAASATK